jgi:hypothetical protein
LSFGSRLLTMVCTTVPKANARLPCAHQHAPGQPASPRDARAARVTPAREQPQAGVAVQPLQTCSVHVRVDMKRPDRAIGRHAGPKQRPQSRDARCVPMRAHLINAAPWDRSSRSEVGWSVACAQGSAVAAVHKD